MTETEDQSHERPAAEQRRSCVVLIGAMGSGKSSVGWYLARNLGYGFIDLDEQIETRQKKKIAAIFDEKGEDHFRALEEAEVERLRNLRSHVVATGGGAVVSDKNWEILSSIGVCVWLNPPASEMARRLLANEAELKQRPLLADVLDQKTTPERLKLLTERLTAIVGQRADRYRQAPLAITDAFSTPESTARLLRDILHKEGLLEPGGAQQTYDRWQVM